MNLNPPRPQEVPPPAHLLFHTHGFVARAQALLQARTPPLACPPHPTTLAACAAGPAVGGGAAVGFLLFDAFGPRGDGVQNWTPQPQAPARERCKTVAQNQTPHL
eukprot:1158232-Pelagomonas_calceolata.AAC.1